MADVASKEDEAALQAAMLARARAAMALSHAPHSDFPVGACVRAVSGQLYAGCNIENASYPEGWCAETTAISHMIMAGENQITHVLVIAEKQSGATPCGGCRQRLSEFVTKDAVLYLCDEQGVSQTMPFTDIFPSGFSL
ncbi:MAG: cytidine deaminase [Pseudomonadota bacterium]